MRISWLKLSHASNEKSLLSESSPSAPTACFPFGIFLWLPYKIFTSNFKMLIEDRKMKNPWIWIQTNLFPIKWIEKTFVRVKIVGQSKKFKLFFYCTWNNMKFNLLPSLQSCFFLYDFFWILDKIWESCPWWLGKKTDNHKYWSIWQ